MAEPRIPVSINRLCCRICSDLLQEPVTIPCGHNFCLRCIDHSWDGVWTDFTCPECQQRFPSRPALIRNTTLAEVVKDTMRSESRKRREQHPPEPPPKRAWNGAETSGRTWCWRHTSPLDVYCCTDELIICAQCASEDHRGHRIGVVGLERTKKQEELSRIQTRLRQILKEQEKLENAEEFFEQINEEARETEDHCESVIVRVTECLQKHYLSVRKVIGAQAEEAVARVPTLRTKMEEMKKMDAELDHLAQSENSVQFLQKWPNVRSLCGDLLQFFNEDQLSPFEVTKQVIEKLGRQLQEFCDKQFASISHASDKKEEESDVEADKEERSEAIISQSHGPNGINQSFIKKKEEPKTREEFLQYACDLLLDPTTAHKDLTLSGDKEVMLCSQTCPTPPIRSPQRFVHRRQVLCRDGLQGNRCYYEVEMKGDKAEIALTYKGINRKSIYKTSAFGANANSWSLDRSTSYSVSHRGESVQLTARPRNPRIGVYLDFEAGTLSFFEVQQEKMVFLYKVQAEFTEPLYPGFWLGEKCSIKICDLKR